MDPILETGITFGWTFEKRARAPFEGDLEIIPKERQEVVVRRVNWPKAVQAWVSRPSEIWGAVVRGEKPPPFPEINDELRFAGRYEPPDVTITVEKGSKGYAALFEMRVLAFNAEYRSLDAPKRKDYSSPPSPKFDMQFMLGERRCKLIGCFVLGMTNVGGISRVEISADIFDDGSGGVRLVDRFPRAETDDEAAEI